MTPIIGEAPVAPSPSPAVGVDRESLILDGLDLNDGGTRTLVGLEFTPAKKLLEWIKGADADGSKLLRMARHENSEFDLRILIRNSTRDLVLDTVGGIIDKLQEAERQSAGGLGRGLELVWSPMGTSYSYTFYVLAGESNLLRAEDFYKLGKPHLELKLYCSPFGYGPEVSTATTTSSLPLVTMTVADMPGDVPAECRITVTDAAGQSRDYVAVGLQNLSYDAATSLTTASADFVTSGFAGVQSGSDYVAANLTTTPVAVCSSAELTHVGTYRNIFRMLTSPGVQVRMAWRQGRDQWTAEPYHTLPASDAWCEVDLGQSKIRTAPLGTQTWQWRLEAKALSTGTAIWVDYHLMLPSEIIAKARRTLTYETPTTFSAHDDFAQSAGALTGKTLPAGGTWAGAGDADDFSVETSGHTAQRTAQSDAAFSGRLVTASTPTLTNVAVQCDVKVSSLAATPSLGVVARYTDASNTLLGVVSPVADNRMQVDVYTVIAGSFTSLAVASGPLSLANTYYTVRLATDTTGRYFLWVYATGDSPGDPLIQGLSSTLATGGTLATGKVGFFDGYIGTGAAVTRNYNNWLAFVPTTDAAIFASQSTEFRSYGDDPILREDSTGTYWGRPAEARGGRMWLPPAGEEDRSTRIAVLARRSDIETQPSANVTDATSVAVSHRPRWINIPRQA